MYKASVAGALSLSNEAEVESRDNLSRRESWEDDALIREGMCHSSFIEN